MLNISKCMYMRSAVAEARLTRQDTKSRDRGTRDRRLWLDLDD